MSGAAHLLQNILVRNAGCVSLAAKKKRGGAYDAPYGLRDITWGLLQKGGFFDDV